MSPEPYLHPPATVEEIQPAEFDLQPAEIRELVYIVARSGIFADTNESIPPWTVFHSKIEHSNDLKITNVAYNPILMAPPNDYSTVYTIVRRQQEAIHSLGFTHAPAFFDMGLLTKSLEIYWAKQDELSAIIPCQGGAHAPTNVTF